MTLATAFTRLFGVRHPIALAPMGGSAGGALAAAVSNGGGLGLLGSGNGDREWLARELPLVAQGTSGPWGVGFQSWAIDPGAVECALRYEPRAVMLSFGDPRPFAGLVRQSSAALIIQVTDLDEARQAVDAGADVLVAQGTEAGGHGARRGWSTLAFVPAVVDLVAPVPVLAAGGIADGRGVAAALTLGACGALIGTRFLATAEALADPDAKKAIVDGVGEQTERSSVLDIARGSRWPLEYTGRTLGHPFLDRWRDAEAELAADPHDVRRAYQEGVARGDLPAQPVWASQAIGLIHDLPPAGDLVGVLAAQAEEALARAVAGQPSGLGDRQERQQTPPHAPLLRHHIRQCWQIPIALARLGHRFPLLEECANAVNIDIHAGESSEHAPALGSAAHQPAVHRYAQILRVDGHLIPTLFAVRITSFWRVGRLALPPGCFAGALRGRRAVQACVPNLAAWA